MPLSRFDARRLGLAQYSPLLLCRLVVVVVVVVVVVAVGALSRRGTLVLLRLVEALISSHNGHDEQNEAGNNLHGDFF